MGGGMAMNFLNAGVPVTLVETRQDALDRGIATVRRNYENTAKRGRLTLAEVEKRMALLTPTLLLNDLAQSDLIIEAVFEEMAVKKALFATLDAIVKPGAILATNTSRQAAYKQQHNSPGESNASSSHRFVRPHRARQGLTGRF